MELQKKKSVRDLFWLCKGNFYVDFIHIASI